MPATQRPSNQPSRKRAGRGGTNTSATSAGKPDAGRRPSRSRGIHPDLQIGQTIRLKLESLTNEGECVARVGGFVLFVAEGLPGEVVEAEIVSIGRDFGRAKVVRAKSRSRTRTTPQCQHFGVCGGCQWQHVAYREQLRWKEELLRTSLEYCLSRTTAHGSRKRQDGAGRSQELPLRPILAAPDPWGTRSKLLYQLAWLERGSGRKMLLCHNRVHSPLLEPIRACPVHHPAGDKVARAAFRIVRDDGLPVALPHSVHDALKSILVRTSGTTGKSHVVLVATGQHFCDLTELSTELLQIPAVEGVHLNIQPDPLSTYLGKETIHLAGERRLLEEIGGVQFSISPDSFFQTNITAAGQLLNVVTRAATDTNCDSILDLYAGAGLFALPLAIRGMHVTAVEENARAVEDALVTMQASKIEKCEYLAGRVEAVVKRLPRSRKFHTIILDPPREGCREWVTRLIARGLRPKRIIYVSCNPTALAKDLAILSQSGYRLDEIQPIDMFPHTAHIEAVAVLQRK